MEPKENSVSKREAACDDRDVEFARRLEQKEAEFVKRQEQQSKREAEFAKCQEQLSKREAEFVEQLSQEEARFVKRQEQQLLELAASGNAREAEAVVQQREEATRAEVVTPQRQTRKGATSREVAVKQPKATGKRTREEVTRAEVVTPQQQARKAAASATRDELGHRTGALLDASQSRDILLLYFGLIESGMKENPAAARTAELLRIGRGKVFKVNTGVGSFGVYLASTYRNNSDDITPPGALRLCTRKMHPGAFTTLT